MKTYEPESEWLIGYGLGCTPSTERGVYVDLGCSHPVNKSLTAFLRDFGWTGLAVDGNPDYAPEWEQAGFKDHFLSAVLSDNPEARFVIHDNSFTSRISDSPSTDYPERWGINRVEERAGMYIEFILSKWKISKINLLSCDLEGHDLQVLKTFHWDQHQPDIVIVEHTAAGEAINHELLNFVMGQGYDVLHFFAANVIFKRK